ncbi:MAG: hypothetical protein H6R00_4847 [Proteobacteria bacterium]|nr:hypothetical protein [Pseudomonadota bacterium]
MSFRASRGNGPVENQREHLCESTQEGIYISIIFQIVVSYRCRGLLGDRTQRQKFVQYFYKSQTEATRHIKGSARGVEIRLSSPCRELHRKYSSEPRPGRIDQGGQTTVSVAGDYDARSSTLFRHGPVSTPTVLNARARTRSGRNLLHWCRQLPAARISPSAMLRSAKWLPLRPQHSIRIFKVEARASVQ